MLEHIGDVLGASFCHDDVKKCSSSLNIVSARTQICVLTVCQQQRWQVLEHCANSRVRASVGTLSLLTVDVGVPTLERTPWDTVTVTFWWAREAMSQPCPCEIQLRATADPSPVRSLDRFAPPKIPVGMPVLVPVAEAADSSS